MVGGKQFIYHREIFKIMHFPIIFAHDCSAGRPSLPFPITDDSAKTFLGNSAVMRFTIIFLKLGDLITSPIWTESI